MKLYLIYILFTCSVLCVSAETEQFHTFKANTLIVSSPRLDAKILTVLKTDVNLKVGPTTFYYLKDNPFCTRITYYPARIEGKRVWLTDDVEQLIVKGRKAIFIKHKHNNIFYFLSIPIFLFLASILFYLYQRSNILMLFKSGGLFPIKTSLLCLMSILLLRALILCWVFYASGNRLANPIDEHEYFKVAYDLVHFDWLNQWKYTIGYGVLLTPLVFLTHATTYWDIIDETLFMNSFIWMSLALAFLFFIIQKFADSTKTAIVTLYLVSFVPLFCFPVEMWSSNVFKSLFSYVDFNTNSWLVYYVFLGLGYNGLSDYSATAVLLSCVCLGLYMPYKIKYCALLATLFAFACMIRVSNILFAPLMAYIFWIRWQKGDFPSFASLFKLAFVVLLTFFITFSPQFILNYYHFHSILTFPYILHPKATYEGFSFQTLNAGINFLINCNYTYVVLGIMGLIFAGNNHKRIFLGLLTLPLMLFFCGYAAVVNNPIRFIIIAHFFFLVAFVSSNAWRVKGLKKEKYIAFFIIFISVVCIAPSYRSVLSSLPFHLETWRYGYVLHHTMYWTILVSSIAVAFLFLQKELLYFVLIFLTLFFSGSAKLCFIVMVALLLYIVYVWLMDVFVSCHALRMVEKGNGFSKER